MLETPQGPLFESNAIARYIASKDTDGILYPSSSRNSFARSQIDAWVDTASNLSQPVGQLCYPIVGMGPHDKQTEGLARSKITQQLQSLNHHLQSRTYLVGPHTTLADIVLATEFIFLYVLVCSALAQLASRLYTWAGSFDCAAQGCVQQNAKFYAVR